MQTRLLYDAGVAGELLRQGKVVAFPTETVFGLGGDARNSDAIARLFEAKGRPADNPLIVHIAEVAMWVSAARELTPAAAALLEAFAPGPLTVVLPKHPRISMAVTAGLDTVGIRIPRCPAALEMLRSAAVPIAAPSANRSGRPSGTHWKSVLEDLDGHIDAILALEVPFVGLESTVVDCTQQEPVLLRSGAISLDELRQVVPTTRQLDPADQAGAALSPGLRHPHYRPRAQVRLLTQPEAALVVQGEVVDAARSAFCGLTPAADAVAWGLCRRYSTIEDYARDFYEFLREADRRELTAVYVEVIAGAGLATALRDRQYRAAGSS